MQTVASGDQISNTARLEESRQFTARIENIDELNHLHETQSNDGCFCVISECKTIDKSSTARDDILQSTADFDGINVVWDDNAEVWCLEEIAENWSHFRVLDSDGGLAELLVGDFVSQVGAHQDGAWNLQRERLAI